jgi:hypothetical protein
MWVQAPSLIADVLARQSVVPPEFRSVTRSAPELRSRMNLSLPAAAPPAKIVPEVALVLIQSENVPSLELETPARAPRFRYVVLPSKAADNYASRP